MFGQLNGMMGNFQMMQKLMRDENFKVFISHPKVQELFKDEEFKEVAKTKDFSKILSHPKFAVLMQDSELASLMAKINLQGMIQR